MALTPQQVSEKKFTSTRFKNGYDETEVDAFLDTVEAELTRLLDEQASLRAELEAARSAPAPAPVEASGPAPISAGQSEMEELLRRTLLLGQRTADEAVAEAKAEAARLKAEAYTESEAARMDSERRIADTERAAALRHSTALAEHEAVRRQLEDATEALRAFEADYRGRLRSYLELQLRDLDAAVLRPAGPDPSTEAQAVAAGTSGPDTAPQSGDSAAASLEAAAATMASPPDVDTPAGSDVAESGPIPLETAAAESKAESQNPANAPVFTDPEASAVYEATSESEPAADSTAYPPAPAAAPHAPALPALPPLPEWMSADAGFGTPTPPAPGSHGE